MNVGKLVGSRRLDGPDGPILMRRTYFCVLVQNTQVAPARLFHDSRALRMRTRVLPVKMTLTNPGQELRGVK